MFEAPWSAGNQRLVKHRRRLARACDACYTRKIRCNLTKPRCRWCDKHDRHCTFERIFASPEKDQLHAAADVPVCPPTVTEELSHSFARTLQAAGPQLGNICTFNGMPVLADSSRKWIEACTGEEIPLHRFSTEARVTELSLADTSDEGTLELPERALLLEEVNLYLSSAYGMFFPVIDKVLFQQTVEAAYDGMSSSVSPGLKSAKVCVFAFHALALTVVERPGRFSHQPSTCFARKAYRLLPDLLSEAATLDGLQALLLLCLCFQGLAGDVFIIDYLLSSASRFVIHLKANLSVLRAWQAPSAANYHARHLFWITHVCDKGFSLVTGLAPRLDMAQCDLDCASQITGNAFSTTHIQGDPVPGSYLYSYTQLAAIHSKIYTTLYSPSVLSQPDAALLQTIRDLDCALEEWRLSLAPSIRPSLQTHTPTRTGPDEPTPRPLETVDMRASVFHLQYHYCLCMIHQTSSRVTTWKQNHNTHAGGSSLAVSVAASRSLLAGFLYSPPAFELGPQNLLFSLPFFLQASTVLFCNILASPNSMPGVTSSLENDNEADLRLLRCTAEHVIAQASSEDPACYSAKIALAGELVSELHRLGLRAVERRVKDQESVVCTSDDGSVP
ncbi:C6 zinc finger domain protein [Aspergillus tubingensis]|uniref:C6 zinc finger domain protein n=1 Tax=Aspergillus niger TaxID=5061 RepID=A0A100IQP9_ASPNG|nr:C6 zinc finger domain protein [Aspergillus tubingensis]GAQ45572.1 C6 zinc finger domain protein [Aspergillus niger]GFN11515.1 C6 zinc finger domain protein [Aspergillus tubingensis]